MTDVDDTLVARAVAGDSRALGALWERHRGWLAALLTAHASCEDEIDDVLQDVAMAMVRRLREVRSHGAIRAWLRSVAVNRAVDRRRRQSPVSFEPDASPAPKDGSGDRADSVAACLRALPIELREVLVLRAVDGLSQREIATTLEVPETTVETRLVRARRKLRESLERCELRECS